MPPNSVISTLKALDPDPQDIEGMHTFELVPGEGSQDNAFFTIDGNALKNTVVFDATKKTKYFIRIRTTDPAGDFTKVAFIITVDYVNKPPTAIRVSGDGVISSARRRALSSLNSRRRTPIRKEASRRRSPTPFTRTTWHRTPDLFRIEGNFLILDADAETWENAADEYLGWLIIGISVTDSAGGTLEDYIMFEKDNALTDLILSRQVMDERQPWHGSR